GRDAIAQRAHGLCLSWSGGQPIVGAGPVSGQPGAGVSRNVPGALYFGRLAGPDRPTAGRIRGSSAAVGVRWPPVTPAPAAARPMVAAINGCETATRSSRVLEAYRQHVAERGEQGVPPKPLNAEQTAQLVEL